jgi:hypothetical protein
LAGENACFPCAHLQRRSGVIDIVRDHRADDANIIDACRGVRQKLAHRCPGLAVLRELPRRGEKISGLGSFEFSASRTAMVWPLSEITVAWIEQIHMGRTARHVEKNDSLRSCRVMRRAYAYG